MLDQQQTARMLGGRWKPREHERTQPPYRAAHSVAHSGLKGDPVMVNLIEINPLSLIDEGRPFATVSHVINRPGIGHRCDGSILRRKMP